MPDRRTFLTSLAGTTLAAPFAAASPAASPDATQENRKIRIGAFNVGEFTFWGIWADLLAAQGPLGTPMFNMELTHCWDVKPEQAQKFAAKYGCEAVTNYDGMLGKVDAIAFGGMYEVPWQHLLARPYVESGVPTYLSRPFSYRLRDIDMILELAAKHNTPLMASSVGEHFLQSSDLKRRLENVGTIKSVHGIGNSREYAGHFHLQWFVLRVLGYDVDQVSVITDNDAACTYLQETMRFRGSGEQPPFLAALHAGTEVPYLSLRVVGERGEESTMVNRSPERHETLYQYFSPQLFDMQRAFSGIPFQSFDVIRKKTQLFLAGYYSHLERGGAPVAVASVPVDWAARPLRPGWIDEAMFRG